MITSRQTRNTYRAASSGTHAWPESVFHTSTTHTVQNAESRTAITARSVRAPIRGLGHAARTSKVVDSQAAMARKPSASESQLNAGDPAGRRPGGKRSGSGQGRPGGPRPPRGAGAEGRGWSWGP